MAEDDWDDDPEFSVVAQFQPDKLFTEEKIPWEKFETYLSTEFGVNKEDLVPFKKDIAKEELCFKSRVKKMMQWFSPIISEKDYANSDEKGKMWTWCFSEIARLWRMEWFHGFLSGDAAERRLKDRPSGNFLVRFSESKPGSYALAMTYLGNTDFHWIITPTKVGKEVKLYQKFDNLYELITHHQKVEKIKDSPIKLGDPCPKDEPSGNRSSSTQSRRVDTLKIDKSDLEIGVRLGGGHFGEVFKAIWQGTTDVAVKKLNAEGEFSKEFLDEVDMLRSLRHANIVSFYGICIISEKVAYMVTELMPLGSVKSLLETNKERWQHDLDPLDLILMAKDAAAGMLYLSSNSIAHRDLAARNLLVGYRPIPRKTKNKDGKEEVSLLGGYMVKVADFGIAKRLESKSYYVSKASAQIPIKWTAPEAITQKKFTVRSDVWSFGIVLYELFEFGQEPYPELGNKEVKARIGRQEPMHVLLSLQDCPDGIEALMKDCLDYDPTKRPSFRECFDRLTQIEKDLESNQERNKWKESSGLFDNLRKSKSQDKSGGYYGEESPYSGEQGAAKPPQKDGSYTADEGGSYLSPD